MQKAIELLKRNGVNFDQLSDRDKVRALMKLRLDTPYAGLAEYALSWLPSMYDYYMNGSTGDKATDQALKLAGNVISDAGNAAYETMFGNNTSVGAAKPTGATAFEMPSSAIQGMNINKPQLSMIYPEDNYSYNAISSKYVASFICPSEFVERRPTN